MKIKNFKNTAMTVVILCFSLLFGISSVNTTVKAAMTPWQSDQTNPTPLPIAQPHGSEIVIPTKTKLHRQDDTYARLAIANHGELPVDTHYDWQIEPTTLINGYQKGIVLVRNLTLQKFISIPVKVRIAGQHQVKLIHNAYLYNQRGQRANQLLLRADSVANVSGQKKIRGRKYLQVDGQYYLAAGNIAGTKRKLHSRARIYNQYGELTDEKSVSRGRIMRTYGASFKLRGKVVYAIGNHCYVLASHFQPVQKKDEQKPSRQSDKQLNRLMHSSYIYNDKGHRINSFILAPGSRLAISKRQHQAAGRNFYAIGRHCYVPARNVTGVDFGYHPKALKIYNRYGKQIGVLPPNTRIWNYGDPFKIKGKNYFIIAKGKLINSKELLPY